jgi:hypothetical protein
MRLSSSNLLPATPPLLSSMPITYEDYGHADYLSYDNSLGEDMSNPREKSYSAPVLSTDSSNGGGESGVTQENGKSSRGKHGRKVKSSSTKSRTNRLKENNENEGETLPQSYSKETGGGLFPKILTTRNPSMNR